MDYADGTDKDGKGKSVESVKSVVKKEILRRVALVGLAIVLLVDLVSSLRSPSGLVLGIVMLVVFPVAVALVSQVLMPDATRTLLQNKDLLVPLALVTVAGRLLDWLAAAPILGLLFRPSFSLQLLNLSFSLSLRFLCNIALGVAYATWVTGAVVELVRTGKNDPCLALPLVCARCWRMLGLLFVGWAVMLLASAAILLLMPVIAFFALVPLLVFAVVWNFATSAVLPVAWREQAGFWQSFHAGVRANRAILGQIWPMLLAQMLLLGLVFFYYSSGSGNTNVSWSVNAFWTGGYENECRWYGKLAEACHAAKLHFVESLLTLLFGVLAVVIKIAIVQRLLPEMPSATPADSNPSGVEPSP